MISIRLVEGHGFVDHEFGDLVENQDGAADDDHQPVFGVHDLPSALMVARAPRHRGQTEGCSALSPLSDHTSSSAGIFGRRPGKQEYPEPFYFLTLLGAGGSEGVNSTPETMKKSLRKASFSRRKARSFSGSAQGHRGFQGVSDQLALPGCFQDFRDFSPHFRRSSKRSSSFGSRY